MESTGVRRIVVFGAAALLSACSGGGDSTEASSPAGVIDHLQVVSTVDAFGGATPAGAAGPYQVITGIVHGRLDPKSPDNAGIVDLGNAPRDANGYVDYTTDVVILRPKNPANARRVLFYDVVNRGNKLAMGSFIGGGALTTGAAPPATFPSILRRGYTVVWSGWQGNVAQTGNGATAAVGTSFPVATNPDGSMITGLSREEYIPDYAGGAANTIALSYPPASLTDMSEVTFTARQSWLNGSGEQDYAAASVPVTNWHYVANTDGTYSVSFTPPAAVPDSSGAMVPPDAGTIYSFVYRASKPTVNGIGLAAVRDLVTFLKSGNTDGQGAPNPLNDMKTAVCASGSNCPANPSTNFDVALGEGISQSGRFLRDFLYQGFNKDSDGNKVFDGMMSIISAGRRAWINERFSQGGRWSKQHEDHWMPGDQFPFTYAVTTDPLTGKSDGLMKNCLANNTCPKIMQIDGAFEWWGGRASLVVTDGQGHDLALPDNVRYYLVSGTQHGGGAGVSTGIVTQPAAGSMCQFAPSPVSETPVERALIPAMENWVVSGTAPPPSKYPTIAAGTAVPPAPASFGFPNLSQLMVPSSSSATPTPVNFTYTGIYNQVLVTDYSTAVPVVDLTKQYMQFEPKVDANGNDVSGILMPELQVPLATYAGWNLRGTGHAVGEGCSSLGSDVPFAVSAATKSPADPRPSLDALYSGRADYAAKVAAAADSLVAQGFLTQLDADNIYKAGAATVSSALIPNP